MRVIKRLRVREELKADDSALSATRQAFAAARKSTTATSVARKAFIAAADAAAFTARQAFAAARKSAAAAAFAARKAFAVARRTFVVASKARTKGGVWTKPKS